MDFARVLAGLIRFFEEHQIRHGAAGAIALHALGVTRATSDLDFVVEESGAEELREHLAALGYEQLHASAGFSNHLHPDKNLGRLDFIYLDPHTADVLFAGAPSNLHRALVAGAARGAPRGDEGPGDEE